MTRLYEAAGRLFEHRLQTISIYLLSKANLSRSASEIEAISLAIADLLTDLQRLGVAIGVAGDLSLVGKELRENVHRVTAAEPASSRRINLCIAYDPMDELRTARQRAGAGDLLEHLWVMDPVDLVIRTGDAQTLSNFLPLQCAYARIAFRSELFNDISLEQMMDEVRHHEGQELLYGE